MMFERVKKLAGGGDLPPLSPPYVWITKKERKMLSESMFLYTSHVECVVLIERKYLGSNRFRGLKVKMEVCFMFPQTNSLGDF